MTSDEFPNQDNNNFDEADEVVDEVVQLGFVGPVEKNCFDSVCNSNAVFKTKLGGFPAWLYPDCPPTSDDVKCGVCKNPLTFLLQIHTAEDFPPSAYHRVLYLFVCPNGNCHKESRSKSFKVLRSQLPRENDYYEITAEDKDTSSDYDSEEEEENWELKKDFDTSQRCWVCGLFGNKRCSKCQTALYCSRVHQLLDWNIGSHRTTCISDSNFSPFGLNNHKHCFGFPPRSIYCEVEKTSEEMKHDVIKQVEKLMKQVSVTQPDTASSKQVMVSGDEQYENTNVEVDQAFLDFQRRISHDQSQVLRYSRTHYGQISPEPLWVSDTGKPGAANILPCQICGEARTFEMQILPQLLNFLPIDNKNPHSLDWGTFLIYTCPNNCWPEGEDVSSPDVITSENSKKPVYITEVSWHQDFSNQGIGENIRKNHFA